MTTASAIPAFERPMRLNVAGKRPVSRLVDDDDETPAAKPVAAAPGKVTKTVAEAKPADALPPVEAEAPASGKAPVDGKPAQKEAPPPPPVALPAAETAPAPVVVSPEALAAAAALQAQGLTGQDVKVLDVAAAIDASYGAAKATPANTQQAPNVPQVRTTVRKATSEPAPAVVEAAAARIAESTQSGFQSGRTGEALVRQGEPMPPPVQANTRALTENLNRWRPC